MKSIKVYAADEIIDDIKATAKKLNMSASRYLTMFHIMQQEMVYPDAVRGSNVAGETAAPIKRGLKVATENTKKTIQAIRDEVDAKAQSMTGFSGSYSKAQQVGKK